jgi:hypothetical protein
MNSPPGLLLIAAPTRRKRAHSVHIRAGDGTKITMESVRFAGLDFRRVRPEPRTAIHLM